MNKERRNPDANSLRLLVGEQWRYLLTLKRRRNIKRQQQLHINSTIEEIVEGTDQKVRIIRNYKKQLIECAANQITYVDSLAKSINVSTHITRDNFSNNTLITAMFQSYPQLIEQVSQSKAVRTLLQSAPPSLVELQRQPKVYLLLKSSPQQKLIFMPAIVNDKVINDVAQQQLSFVSKNVAAINTSKIGLTSQLKTFLHNNIVNHVKIQLEPLLADANGLACLLDEKDYQNPIIYLNTLKQTMREPQKTLSVQSKNYRINRFGILAEDEQIPCEHEFTLTTLSLREQQPFHLMAISLPLAELV